MSNTLKKFDNIFFYIPEEFWPAPFPSDNQFDWPGFKSGIYCWTLQTYMILKSQGLSCHLVKTLPKIGIIVAHRGLLADSFRPSRHQYLVCMQADWSRHPFAHAHISQNIKQTEPGGVPKIDQLFFPGKTFFARLWPQPGIIPRDPNRESKLKTICYFGLKENLAPELKSNDWISFLKEMKIEWNIVDNPEKWSDYSKADAVLFARDFEGKLHINKPGTKLYNAWIARCVPICTKESAYLHEAGDSNGAILIDGYQDLKTGIIELTKNNGYSTTLKAGEKNVSRYTREVLVAEWIDMFEKICNEHLKPNSHARFVTFRQAGYLINKFLKKI